MTAEEEEKFEKEHQVPVHAGGSLVVARWGLGMAVLALGIAFACFLLTYFYLRLENAAWPPAGIPLPPLWPGIIAAALVVLGALPMRRALHRVRAGDDRGLFVSLTAAVVLLAAGLAVQIGHLISLGYAWTAHAYSSIFYTLAGFVLGVAIAALLMGALTLFWATRGYFDARRHTFVLNVATFWTATAGMWVVGFATLYLGARLT